jgi:hypothetical protein
MLNFRTIGALQQKTKPIDPLQHKNEPYESLVSGHDFRRAERRIGITALAAAQGLQGLKPSLPCEVYRHV